MSMISVKIIVKTVTNEYKVGNIELNEYYSVEEIKNCILDDLNAEISKGDWTIDTNKDYTLSISPSDRNKALGNVKLEDGCIVYLQEVPKKMIIDFKEEL